MGGMNRAVRAGIIKYGQIAGSADSSTVGLAMSAEDGVAITTSDTIIACIELAQTTNAKTDRTSASAIIAGGKITVPTSTNDVVACWWLAQDAGLQVASPFIVSEIAVGTTALGATTIAGISTTDIIISAISIHGTTGAWIDQTSDMVITASNTVTCANDLSGQSLWVMWMDLTGRGFSALNLQFGLANIDTSNSTDPSLVTLTGIKDEDVPLVVLCLDETDGNILDEFTSVTSVSADDTLSITEPSPTASSGAELIVFYQKSNDLAS